MSASLSCPPDKYPRTLISLKTPATQGTQTGKNATNSKPNERLEAGEKNPESNRGVSSFHNSLRLLKCKSKHRLPQILYYKSSLSNEHPPPFPGEKNY